MYDQVITVVILAFGIVIGALVVVGLSELYEQYLSRRHDKRRATMDAALSGMKRKFPPKK
jgi:small basic protein